MCNSLLRSLLPRRVLLGLLCCHWPRQRKYILVSYWLAVGRRPREYRINVPEEPRHIPTTREQQRGEARHRDLSLHGCPWSKGRRVVLAAFKRMYPPDAWRPRRHRARRTRSCCRHGQHARDRHKGMGTSVHLRCGEGVGKRGRVGLRSNVSEGRLGDALRGKLVAAMATRRSHRRHVRRGGSQQCDPADKPL